MRNPDIFPYIYPNKPDAKVKQIPELIVTCLHCPLRGNDLINMFMWEQIRTQQLMALFKELFSMWFMPTLYKKNQWESSVSRERESDAMESQKERYH
jgi:hypothetical protein